MKKHSSFWLSLAVLAATIFSFAACSKDDDPQGSSNVTFRLTDGPGLYDAVYVDIKEIQVQTNAGGWVTVTPARQGVYDLLKLRNGMDTLLSTATLPAGRISQMRLILNSNNSVVVNGTAHALNTPSAEESGLKLNINEELKAGGSYEVWIDFDAGKSIVQQGNGQYRLKPVIRAFTAETNGKITGSVFPLNAQAVVYASNGTETYAAIPDNNGNFAITGMASGTYTVTIDVASGIGLSDKVISNVSVSFGQTTSLGLLQLQ